MKQVVQKYEFNVEPRFTVEMPAGSRILFIENMIRASGVHPHIWSLVDPDQPRAEIRTFETVRDGDEVETKGRYYVGSLMTDYKAVHIFEIVTPGAL